MSCRFSQLCLSRKWIEFNLVVFLCVFNDSNERWVHNNGRLCLLHLETIVLHKVRSMLSWFPKDLDKCPLRAEPWGILGTTPRLLIHNKCPLKHTEILYNQNTTSLGRNLVFNNPQVLHNEKDHVIGDSVLLYLTLFPPLLLFPSLTCCLPVFVCVCHLRAHHEG